jgi:hypothetical protein
VFSSCFQLAGNQRHITKTFQHLVMGNCWLSYLRISKTAICMRSYVTGHITFNRSDSATTLPHTSATYLSDVLASNCFARCDIATSVLAITSNPEVSLSIRCTSPARCCSLHSNYQNDMPKHELKSPYSFHVRMNNHSWFLINNKVSSS